MKTITVTITETAIPTPRLIEAWQIVRANLAAARKWKAAKERK